MVQQHFTLVPTLTAGENLALARPAGRLRPGARQARRRVEELAKRYGLPVRPTCPSTGSRSARSSGWRSCVLSTPTPGC